IAISSARRAKSAERMLGAIRGAWAWSVMSLRPHLERDARSRRDLRARGRRLGRHDCTTVRRSPVRRRDVADGKAELLEQLPRLRERTADDIRYLNRRRSTAQDELHRAGDRRLGAGPRLGVHDLTARRLIGLLAHVTDIEAS